MQIITRAEAKAAGLTHYFTGKPCRHGHVDVRFTSIGKCKTCARLAAMAHHEHTTDKRRKYANKEEFIVCANKKHQHLYNYEEVEYQGCKVPVRIVCKKHGAFMQRPSNHVQGQGCPQCMAARVGLRSRSTVEKFLQQARKVWGHRFDYSKVVYKTSHKHITIRCRDHGDFQQTPTNHLTGKEACPRCNHMKSAGEAQVAAFLSIFTPTNTRNRQIIKPKELDIYLPEHKLAVEYCGEYWHSMGSKEEEKANKNRHLEKHLAASDAGVELITLYATEWENRKFQVKRLLRARLGKLRGRVFARKCELREVPTPEARAFYDKYHIQGGAGYGVHYGLYWKDKLVACMRFTNGGNDRGAAAKNRTWTLSRYATRVGVIGGASRLFKAFVRTHSPDTVKSFSDTRLFSGAMYEKLGFTLKATLPPDYVVWSPKLGIRPKPHYQRRYLQKRLKEHGVENMFDPDTDPRTEAEITYYMGAKRLFDCGKKRWVWEV